MTISANPDEANPLRYVCAVCARVLDHSAVHGWQHTVHDDIKTGADHPPVPVADTELAEVRDRCDFCMSEPVISYLITAPLQMVAIDEADEEIPLRRSGATWACCAVCDRLIRKDRWPKVTERWARSFAHSYDVEVNSFVRRTVEDLHRAVAENAAGQPIRLE